jgi:hypothetical protein
MRKSVNASCLVATLGLWGLVTAANALAATPNTAPPSCESLAKLQLPHTKITLARVVPAGTFVAPPPPYPLPVPPSYKDVPAFCRVTAEISPTSDSDIKIEVWMPVSGWNGRFLGQGNGGFAGAIGYAGLGEAVKQGYASAGTNTGHTTVDAAWALGHPEKVIDFGYRGIHEMTRKADAIVQAFYGVNKRATDRPAFPSFFASCSDGGREALMEAQRFPGDYDGILAGAPANYWTHLLVAAMWELRATNLDPASYIPASKIPALSEAVLAACDAQDGLRDGLLNDPRQCHFNPDTMLCKGADSDACLTAPQVAALKKIYAGPHDSHGRQLFPGLVPGGEAGPGGWTPWITGNVPGRSLIGFFGIGYFSNFVYGKPNWDPKTFEIDEATRLADQKTAQALNATNPNLRPFMERGGKLILYHGWSDAAISPLNTIDYYNQVVATMGRKDTEKFVRLYMVPGMQHCGGGPGPFGQSAGPTDYSPVHDLFRALKDWQGPHGTAPSKIIATKHVDNNPAKAVEMTRPLCPYPLTAVYKGSGDPNDADSFVCASQEK